MHYDPLTYEWFLANGFYKVDRQERQPFDHVQRAIGLETIDTHSMTAQEDLCLNITPASGDFDRWMCWIAKAHSFQRHPHVWIYARSLRARGELILLYEGLTGRRWSPGGWDRKNWGESIFQDVGQ